MINIVYGIVFSFLTDDFAVLSFYISPNQLKIGTRTVSYLKDELGALSLHMYSDTYSQLTERGDTIPASVCLFVISHKILFHH